MATPTTAEWLEGQDISVLDPLFRRILDSDHPISAALEEMENGLLQENTGKLKYMKACKVFLHKTITEHPHMHERDVVSSKALLKVLLTTYYGVKTIQEAARIEARRGNTTAQQAIMQQVAAHQAIAQQPSLKRARLDIISEHEPTQSQPLAVTLPVATTDRPFTASEAAADATPTAAAQGPKTPSSAARSRTKCGEIAFEKLPENEKASLGAKAVTALQPHVQKLLAQARAAAGGEYTPQSLNDEFFSTIKAIKLDLSVGDVKFKFEPFAGALHQSHKAGLSGMGGICARKLTGNVGKMWISSARTTADDFDEMWCKFMVALFVQQYTFAASGKASTVLMELESTAEYGSRLMPSN